MQRFASKSRPGRAMRSLWGLPSWLAVASLFLQGHPAAGQGRSTLFEPAKIAAIDAAVTNAIAQKKLPGGVVWLEHNGVGYAKAFGNRAVEPALEAMTEDTIFDAASLTKVVATTPAIMLLLERGKLKLDQSVRTYLPEMSGAGAEAITVRHLLTHTSGLRAGLSLKPAWSGYEAGIKLACSEAPQNKPGTYFRYSDINFILLGELARRGSGMSLDQFAAKEVFGPLGMTNTGYLPPEEWRGRIAPTTKSDDGFYRGVVHDPTARAMGGVAGHAGLFTTTADLARYARMLLQEGTLDGVRILKPETVRLMTSVQSPLSVDSRRGLGWDIDSPYAGPRGDIFPIGSYGHTGWTGGSIWVDPFSRTFLLFMSNRNHPTEEGTVVGLRRELGTLAAGAVVDFDFKHVPGALASTKGEPGTAKSASLAGAVPKVLNGIDVLVKQEFAPLAKLKIGLITNHSGVDCRRRSTIDLLREAKQVELKVLFCPEHGLRGLQDEKVSDSVDEKTGLPVNSLYGDRKAPAPEQLAGLDGLVYDIQDIGCRFYTYLSTLGLCMEAASKAGLKFFVLDRVNPINGTLVEGPVYEGEPHFIAFHSLPLRHGMTLGELARMMKAERGWAVDLTVIPVEGWTRTMWYDETGLPWTNPSPNMRTLAEGIVYPGIGLLESALSVGRGTDTPFEVLGAPYIDGAYLAQALDEVQLPGVRFVPVQFTPKASTFQGQVCGGIHLMVTDRDRFQAVDVGMAIALILKRTYPTQFALEKFNDLLKDSRITEGILNRRTLEDLKAAWGPKLEDFKRRRSGFLLYP